MDEGDWKKEIAVKAGAIRFLNMGLRMIFAFRKIEREK